MLLQSLGYISLVRGHLLTLLCFWLFVYQCFSLIPELFLDSFDVEFFVLILSLLSSFAAPKSSWDPVFVDPGHLFVYQDIYAVNFTAISPVVCNISAPCLLKLNKSIAS